MSVTQLDRGAGSKNVSLPFISEMTGTIRFLYAGKSPLTQVNRIDSFTVIAGVAASTVP